MVLALPVFKIQIILALLFDKKAKKYARFVKSCQKIMLAQSNRAYSKTSLCLDEAIIAFIKYFSKQFRQMKENSFRATGLIVN